MRAVLTAENCAAAWKRRERGNNNLPGALSPAREVSQAATGKAGGGEIETEEDGGRNCAPCVLAEARGANTFGMQRLTLAH